MVNWGEERTPVDGRTPFDTLAVLFERASVRGGARRSLRLAAGAWMAVIAEQWAEAESLIERAARCAAEPNGRPADEIEAEADGALAREVIAAMATTIGAMGRGDRFDLDALHRLRRRLLEDDGCAAIDALGSIGPVLEMSNWFVFAGLFPEAGRIVDSQLDACRRRGDEVGVVWALGCRIELDLRRGRWTQCRLALDEAFERSQRLDLPAGYLHVLAARIAAAQGRSAEVDAHLGQARHSAIDLGDGSTAHRVEAVEGFAALCRAEVDLAAALLRTVAAEVLHGPALASVRLWDGDLIEALVRSRHADEAQLRFEGLCSQPAATPWDDALRSRCVALLERDASAATAAAVSSAAAFRRLGAPFEAARSELIAGELARRSRQVLEARVLLGRAAAGFAALGALPWQAQAERELRACGAVSTSARQRWDGALTEQERAVAAAVAAGASNADVASRLFLSVKTVEAHLTRIYRKAGVGTRAQLAALVGEQRAEPAGLAEPVAPAEPAELRRTAPQAHLRLADPLVPPDCAPADAVQNDAVPA